jgi:ABC-2 type transport system permease protein
MAMKPATPLAAFDPGLSEELGSTIWMEAHWQNPANNRSAEDALEAQRFADLTPAWALQIIAPLIVIGLGFPLLARERESGLWRAIAASGASPATLVAGKALSLCALSFAALSPLIIAAIAAPLSASAPTAPDHAARAAGVAGLYALYLAAIGAATLAVSAFAGATRNALAALAGLWILTAVVAPRVVAGAADLAAPAPNSQTFWAEVRDDLEKGTDGHSSEDARVEALRARVLREYNVASVEALPVSFAGIALQEAEEHGNRVFDLRFSALYDAYERQRNLALPYLWLSPTLAVQGASMALTGADERDHRHFAEAAEAHRRRIILQLNDDMIRNGAGKDFDYIADPALWSAIPNFRYAPPALDDNGRARTTYAFLALAAWTALALSLAFIGVRRWSKA